MEMICRLRFLNMDSQALRPAAADVFARRAGQEAFEAGKMPRVVPRATHEGALKFCALDDLKRSAMDLS
jgi:uncharacterized protein (DUF2237 family)